MTMVAATVIAYEEDMPYFLVVPHQDSYNFFSIKDKQDEQTTSLGRILTAFKAEGVTNIDQWRLGELSAVEDDKGNLMPLYSFEVSDFRAVEKEVSPAMVFQPADQIRPLLMTLKPSAFTSFEAL